MNANANANAESPKATRPPSAEFHLIPETLPGFSDATQNLGPGAHATAFKPIIVPNGVTRLCHDGTSWKTIFAGEITASEQASDAPSPEIASSQSGDGAHPDRTPLFEPLKGRGPAPRLLVVSPPGHTTRINGMPAPRVSLLSVNDRVQFDESPTFHVAIYHRPVIGCVPPELVGARCPVCTIPLTALDQCLVCSCGAALHASVEAQPGTTLDCAGLATECPRCQQKVRLVPCYEPNNAISAAHD